MITTKYKTKHYLVHRDSDWMRRRKSSGWRPATTNAGDHKHRGVSKATVEIVKPRRWSPQWKSEDFDWERGPVIAPLCIDEGAERRTIKQTQMKTRERGERKKTLTMCFYAMLSIDKPRQMYRRVGGGSRQDTHALLPLGQLRRQCCHYIGFKHNSRRWRCVGSDGNFIKHCASSLNVDFRFL